VTGSMLVAVTVTGALVLAVAAFGGSASQAATTDTVTAGKPSELKFTLSKRTVPKGTVTFKVTNRGTMRHDFKIAGKKTPLLASGKNATLKVVFRRAAKYPYLCTVPGHAAAGMKGTLTVR
jgi:uncharacterized cupredoxin-like copper-binding protein